MSSAWSKPLRALATQTAVITIIGLGLAAPATAAQGDQTDTRNDKAATAKAESSEKKSSRGSAETSSKGSTKQETRSSGSAKAEAKSSTKASGSAKSDTTTGPDHSQGNAGTSGTYNSPQPESNADQNDGGANGQCPEGPYCSTRDGSASMNGKGDGEAKGKPCAGCVGKADNKNPKGQYPDGDTDGNMKNGKGNAGYECDRNQGIGQGNPAHTTCDSDTTVVVEGKTCPDGSPLPASGNEADCKTIVKVKTCPDGSPLPDSGSMADCDKTIPPGIGGVDTEVPGSNRPPVVTPPVVAGVETLVPPAGVELTVRPQGEAPAAAPQALPGAAVLPATGATPAMTALSALAFGMLALGSGVLLYRRVNA